MPPSEDAISLTGDQGPTKHTNVDSALGKNNHIGGNCFDYIDKETGIRVSKYGVHCFTQNMIAFGATFSNSVTGPGGNTDALLGLATSTFPFRSTLTP